MKTLGDDYTEERIKQRISNKSFSKNNLAKIYGHPTIKNHRGNIKKRKLTGLQKQYFSLLYRLGKIKKSSYSNNYKYRQDIRKLDFLQRQYLFLSRYDIKKEEDIAKVQEHIRTKIKTTNTAIKVLKAENEKYQDIYNAVRTINKEKQAATFYKLGDKTFWKQNEQLEGAKQVLKKAEITYDEAKKLEMHYSSLILEGEKEIKQMKKELRTSYGLIKDIEYRKELAIKEREKEQQKQNISNEKKEQKQSVKKK